MICRSYCAYPQDGKPTASRLAPLIALAREQWPDTAQAVTLIYFPFTGNPVAGDSVIGYQSTGEQTTTAPATAPAAHPTGT